MAIGTWSLSGTLQVSRRLRYGVFQSSGMGWIPHTFPAWFRASASSHSFSNSPSEMQLTTRASTGVPAGRSSKRTAVPAATGRGERTAHPPRLAKMMTHGCENGSRGSRLVSVTGSSQGTRVPPRAHSLCAEEFSLGRPTESLAGFCRTFGGRHFLFGIRNIQASCRLSFDLASHRAKFRGSDTARSAGKC